MKEALVVKVCDSRELWRSLDFRALIYQSELAHHGVDVHDRTALHLVCVRGGEMVAAARLLGPTPLPLEVARFVEVTKFFTDVRRLVQIGGFWMRPDLRRVSSFTLGVFSSFEAAISRWSEALGAECIFLRTHVKTVEHLYRSVGFKRIRELDFHHPLWGYVYSMYRRVPSRDGRSAIAPLTARRPELESLRALGRSGK